VTNEDRSYLCFEVGRGGSEPEVNAIDHPNSRRVLKVRSTV
jgi:hypothetical protein